MTIKQAKKLLPAMKHFANGGSLWIYKDGDWYKQEEIMLQAANILRANIIEDKHFEARKAFALGEEVEMFYIGVWDTDKNPQWFNSREYRPKPKEPVYEWQWAYVEYEEYVMSEYHTEEEVSEDPDWIKFEPSKRIKK